MNCTQEEIDVLVTQRLEWVSRCASAISHELGNIVLFGEAQLPAPVAPAPGDNGAIEQNTSLLEHFRQLLMTLQTWRHIEQDTAKLMPIDEWWRLQGGMLRQFIRRGVAVTMTKMEAEHRCVHVSLLTRVTAGLLCTIDLQHKDLGRLLLRTAVEGERRMRFDFVPTPALSGAELSIPAVVRSRINADPDHLELAIDEGDAAFVLRFDTEHAPAK